MVHLWLGAEKCRDGPRRVRTLLEIRQQHWSRTTTAELFSVAFWHLNYLLRAHTIH